MSLKKSVAIAAAVGAMAAISVPAMALENEFHGTYTFNTIFSNFQDGGSGNFTPAGWRENRQVNNYLEQRARLQYTAKVSDDLKLVTHFEINNRFGNLNTVTNSQGTQTDVSGSDLDADGLNLVTKHVYLDFNLGKNFNVKTGIQPYKDTIKGIFIDADVPAVMTTTTLGAYKLGLGYSRYNDSSTGASRLGDKATDLFIMDNTFAFTKDTKAALSYYLLADYRTDQAILLNTLGASAETKLGPVSLSGFAAMQAGHQKQQVGAAALPNKSSKYFHGYAANLTAKIAAGPGTAKVAGLFVSGNNNSSGEAHDRGWQNTGISSYNDGGMMVLVRATQNSPTTTDRYIRRVVTNVALATLGYDANLTDKIFANGNVGFAWAPSSTGAPVDKATGRSNTGDFIGTEFNLETGYKLNANLTLRAQAAYAILGPYFKGSATTDGATIYKDPENPYTARLLASFKF